jgi:hypothetical protein
MAKRLVQIAMNARDNSALGMFWAEALGWSLSSEEPGVTNLEPVGFTYPDHVAVCIDILAISEPKTVKNRVHIDLATTSAAHEAALVARLKDLGDGRRRGPGRRPVDRPGRPRRQRIRRPHPALTRSLLRVVNDSRRFPYGSGNVAGMWSLVHKDQ